MRFIVLVSAMFIFGSTNGYASSVTPEFFEKYQWLENLESYFEKINLSLAPVTSCKALNSMFAEDELTGLQKKREWKKYNNKLIPLTAIVVEVDEIPLSDDYLAIFKCAGSRSFVSDFTVRIPAHKEEFAFSLSVGEKRTIAVRLKGYGRLGIETAMDFTPFPGASEQCLPTLDDIRRSNGQVLYYCEDTSELLVRKIDYDMGDGETEPAYIADLKHESGDVTLFLSLPFANGESLYMENFGDKGGVAYLNTLGDCVIRSNEEESGTKRYISQLSDADKSEIKGVLTEKKLSGRETVNNYLEIKAIINSSDEQYSCETRMGLTLRALGMILSVLE